MIKIIEVKGMQGKMLIIGTAIVIVLGILIAVFFLLKKQKRRHFETVRDALEREKNIIGSTPILLELSKLEPIIKNEKMEERYKRWQEKFSIIKEEDLPVIDDMLIELDTLIEKKEYKLCKYKIAKITLEIYKIREAADHLLEQVKEITLSEEKYRSIITKLKTKYRRLNNEYLSHQTLYEELQEAITLQLENIEKRFLDFEQSMDLNEYTEVVHIVKALDTMIEHMGIVVEEVPDLILMCKQLIPKRIKEVEKTSKELEEKGYPLEYLNLSYNLEEASKNVNTIFDRIKVLNLEDCMFELKTILDYLDSLFVDFEKERLSRKVYEESLQDFSNKLKKIGKLVSDIYLQLDDIKKMYDLNQEDVKIIDEVNKTLTVIRDDYKKLLNQVKTKAIPYSQATKEIEEITIRLKQVEASFDVALKSLGNMYDDEKRAREQLEEIDQLLRECKTKMRTFKLPLISDHYFVELQEANEAILEVVKELSKKPIVIKTLNTRVDTARDLVLKLLATTDDMLYTAKLSEWTIVYGNRYRVNKEVDIGLTKAENAFYKGNFKNALENAIVAINIIEPDIHKRLMEEYQ